MPTSPLQIADKLRPLLEDCEQVSIYRDIEAPLIPVLTAMENEGIAMDVRALKDIGDTLAKRISNLSQEITTAAGREFNLNSPKQLGEILFGEMQLVEKPKKTKTGQFKTDEQTLSGSPPNTPSSPISSTTGKPASSSQPTLTPCRPMFLPTHRPRPHPFPPVDDLHRASGLQ